MSSFGVNRTACPIHTGKRSGGADEWFDGPRVDRERRSDPVLGEHAKITASAIISLVLFGSRRVAAPERRAQGCVRGGMAHRRGVEALVSRQRYPGGSSRICAAASWALASTKRRCAPMPSYWSSSVLKTIS